MAPATRDRKKPRILAVDDERITLRTIKRVLENSGYDIVTSEDGQSAVDICAVELPDLVLLDVVMPGLDGFATCRELRKIAGPNYLPILILTGLDDMDSIDKAFDAGSTDFITKPLNWPLLRQRVRYALRQTDLYRQLHISQQQLAKAQSIARLGYWELDVNQNEIKLSGEAQALLCLENRGYALSDFVARLSDEEQTLMLENLSAAATTQAPYAMDHSFATDAGRVLTFNQQAAYGEHKTGVIVGTFQDITERKEAEELIHFHTYFDAGTSLPNRAYLDRQVGQLIENGEDETFTAIVTVSFDRIREIGTTIGNQRVDEFIKKASARLDAMADPITDVARVDTNTLACMIRPVADTDQLESIAARCLQLFREPIPVFNQALHSTVSIGATLFPIDRDHVHLIDHSMTAMKTSIDTGGGAFHLYTRDMDHHARRQIDIEIDLRAGLAEKEFECFFQPQIDTHTGKISGVEALARWTRRNGSVISPDLFIPVAEKTDLIVQLGEYLLTDACHFVKRLQDKTGLACRVGVNLSARQFAQQSIANVIRRVLDDTGLSPTMLEAEITERIAMTDIEYAIETLSELRDLGVKTSMDDFGTGYSSLSYLQKMPLDTLKIDQSFISPIGRNGEGSEIARAIIAMGQSMGLHLIAEGVEYDHQYALLKDLGCDEVQGFLVSKPLARDDFTAFARSHGQSGTGA